MVVEHAGNGKRFHIEGLFFFFFFGVLFPRREVSGLRAESLEST